MATARHLAQEKAEVTIMGRRLAQLIDVAEPIRAEVFVGDAADPA